uniref:Lipocalin n=1 Tax=Echinococcus granulosus TaxID=6210 RepID=A0A068WPK7_ECHGR|nr:hypothetical protein EgrG_000492500 [Echinococcus granulosus]
MRALVLAVGVVLLHLCRCDDQVVEEFDCSSYFSRVLTNRKLDSIIKESTKKFCPKGMRYRMTGFDNELNWGFLRLKLMLVLPDRWNGTTCKVEFTLDSNVNIMQRDKVCYDSFVYIRKNALTRAWGTPWGEFVAGYTAYWGERASSKALSADKSCVVLSRCKEAFVKTQIAPYYSIKRQVPSIQTIEDSATVSAACKYPLLSPDQKFEVKCIMNRYGGYEWRENERSGCYMKGFEAVDEEAFMKTITQLEGPVKCSVLYLMVFGGLKSLIMEVKDTHRFIIQSHWTLDIWSKHCLQMDPIFNQLFLTGFLRLAELTLNAVVKKAHTDVVSGTKFYKLIYKLTEIINAHVVNKTAAAFYSLSTNLISVYRYPRRMAPTANSVDKTSFYVEEMRNPVPLDVTCYAIAKHQAYVQIISLRPISHLCYVGSFGLTSMSDFRKDFVIKLIYRVAENKLGRNLECSSVIMGDRNEIEYNRQACETAVIEKEVHCQCRDHGFVFVTQVTETSDNLKTSVPANIRFNPILLLIFIFNRILALAGVIGLIIIAVSKFLSLVYNYHQNRFYPDFRNFGIVHLLINLMFIDALSTCLDQCLNAHSCLSKGPILLAWNYMQTIISIPYGLAIVLTGKTNRLGRMLWNLTIICAIVCITIQAVLQYYGHLFLNYVCMPLDPVYFIIIVKIVVLLVNVSIFTHYARMRIHRYLDEWIGCMIYTLADIMDVIFGVIMMTNYRADTSQVQATFFLRHMVNRSVMTLVSTIYQVFFKISLMKFYYRIYLIIVRHANLRDIVGYENRYRIFQIINTFSEFDGTKRWHVLEGSGIKTHRMLVSGQYIRMTEA